MPGISVLLNCLPAGFLIFFSFLGCSLNALPLQSPSLPPAESFTPRFLDPCPPPTLPFSVLLSGLYFLVQNWLMLSLNFLDCGKLD